MRYLRASKLLLARAMHLRYLQDAFVRKDEKLLADLPLRTLHKQSHGCPYFMKIQQKLPVRQTRLLEDHVCSKQHVRLPGRQFVMPIALLLHSVMGIQMHQ